MKSVLRWFTVWSEQLTARPLAPGGSWLFRQVLYLSLIAFTLSLLPIWPQVWGPQAYMHRISSFSGVINWLNTAWGRPLYGWVIAAQLLSLVWGLTRFWPVLSALAVWFFTATLFVRGIELSSGGSQLVLIMLVYLAGMALTPSDTRGRRRDYLRTLLANLCWWAARWQLVLLYVIAGLSKLRGEAWLAGDALHYVLQIPEYSLPFLVEHAAAWSGALTVGSWVILAYQVCFPVLIWWRRLRPYVLAFGLAFHLGIALLIGIGDFGLWMMICYLVFLPEDKAVSWLRRGQRLLPRWFLPRGLSESPATR